MSGPLRFGLVGVGMMGREHIRNLKLMPRATVAALVDPVQVSLDAALATLGDQAKGVRRFSTLEALLAEVELDAVVISTPNFTHRAMLDPLFETRLHILCEKPLCTTVADARWAAMRARSHKGVFWTGMEYRFMPPAAKFVEEIHNGAVGRPVMLSIKEHRFPFLVKVGDWNRFSRNTGGTMVEKCCHFFDLMRLILRSEAVGVFSSGAMDVNHLDERYEGRTPDIIDNSFTVVDFENGSRAMLDLSMFAEGSLEQEEIGVVGDHAKLEVFIPSGDLVLSHRVALFAPKQVVRTHVEVDAAALKAGSHHGATFYQLQAFIDAALGDGPVQVTAEDGYRAVAIGAAAELSIREKRRVTMAELGL